jgi:hypothetical protein
MGGMAVDAALIVQNGPVNPGFIEGIGYFFVMTPLAKLESGVLERKRRRGGRGFVALVALPVADRLVDVVKEDSGDARTVWVMTGATPSSLDRIVLVQPLEQSVELVAVQAEGRFSALQESGTIGRCVGIVALQAVFRDRFVLELVLGNLPAHLLVALETQLASCPDQNHLVVGGVGIVTGDALAFEKHLMGAGRIGGHQIVVALLANLARFSGQEQFVIGGMGIVAAGAVSFGDRGVDEGLVEKVRQSVMALEA